MSHDDSENFPPLGTKWSRSFKKTISERPQTRLQAEHGRLEGSRCGMARPLHAAIEATRFTAFPLRPSARDEDQMEEGRSLTSSMLISNAQHHPKHHHGDRTNATRHRKCHFNKQLHGGELEEKGQS